MKCTVSKRKILRILSALALLGSLFGLSSCEPDFKRLEMEELSSPPIPLSIGPRNIQIIAGIGIMISTRPVSDNSKSYDKHAAVELESEDINVIRVFNGEGRREFALVGVSPGQTRLRVYVDGSHEDDITVNVE